MLQRWRLCYVGVLVVAFLATGIQSKNNTTCTLGNNSIYVLAKFTPDTYAELTEPQFPSDHSPTPCTWRISALSSYRIKFVITSLQLSDPRDYIIIRDGPSVNSPVLGEYGPCAKGTLTLYSTSSNAYVHLVTHGRGAVGTLRIMFKALPSSYITCRSDPLLQSPDYCSNRIKYAKVQSGSMTSPNFPQLFAVPKRCGWSISVPSGYRIRIQFQWMGLQCIDRLMISEQDGGGMTRTSFCGCDDLPVFLSREERLWLQLQSRKTRQAGFWFTYKAVSVDECPSDRSDCPVKSETHGFDRSGNICNDTELITTTKPVSTTTKTTAAATTTATTSPPTTSIPQKATSTATSTASTTSVPPQTTSAATSTASTTNVPPKTTSAATSTASTTSVPPKTTSAATSTASTTSVPTKTTSAATSTVKPTTVTSSKITTAKMTTTTLSKPSTPKLPATTTTKTTTSKVTTATSSTAKVTTTMLTKMSKTDVVTDGVKATTTKSFDNAGGKGRQENGNEEDKQGTEGEGTTPTPTTVMVYVSTKAISVACYKDHMTVVMVMENLTALSQKSLRLGDSKCKPQHMNKTHVIYRIPLNQCGTTHSSTDHEISYYNTITGESIDMEQQVISRNHQASFKIHCSYARRRTLSVVSFSPRRKLVVVSPLIIDSRGNFTYMMDLYKSDGYLNPYDTYPVTINMNQRMYAQVLVNASKSLVIFLDTCLATPSPDYYDKRGYRFIDNGCSKDDTLQYDYKMSAAQQFSIAAFRFTNITSSSPVFLHCEVYVCPRSENNSRCQRGCRDRLPRALPREAENELDVLTLGPIYVVNSEPGYSVVSSTSEQVLAVGICVALLGIVTIVLIIAIVMVTKRRRQQASNNPLYISIVQSSD